jgi:hypothetical protein
MRCRNEDSVEDFKDLLIQIMRLADRVTLARLGLLAEITVEGDDAKATGMKFSPGMSEEWEKYPAYFRQTFGYIAASVRDGFATLEEPARPVEVE